MVEWSAVLCVLPFLLHFVHSSSVVVSTHAPWAQTSFLLEGIDFFAQQGKNTSVIALLEAAVKRKPSTPKEEHDLVIEIASSTTTGEDSSSVYVSCLQLHLASRLSSPAIHMLAQATLNKISPQISKHCNSNTNDLASVAVVVGVNDDEHGSGDSEQVVCGEAELENVLGNLKDRCPFDGKTGVYSHDALIANTCQQQQSSSSSSSSHSTCCVPIILVGSPIAPAFGPLLQRLLHFAASLSSSATTGVSVYYRPAPIVYSEKELKGRVQIQGYGVELQIKNMEYSVLDDQKLTNVKGMESVGVDDDDSEEEDLDLEGFNFYKLIQRRPDKTDEIRQFRKQIVSQVKLVGSSEEDKLSVWKIKDLGLQAIARALQSRDALNSIREISSNFPVWAPSLVRKRVPRKLLEEVVSNQRHVGSGTCSLAINGRVVVSPANSNMFGTSLAASHLVPFPHILQTVLQEHTAVSNLARISHLPTQTIVSLLSSPYTSTSSTPATEEASSGGAQSGNKNSLVRFDTGKLFRRVFLNDLERDGMYMGGMWARSVSDVLKSQGEIRFVARNLYTLTVCFDPEDGDALYIVAGMLPRLVRNGAPVRIAVTAIPDLAKLTHTPALVSPAFSTEAKTSLSKAIDALIQNSSPTLVDEEQIDAQLGCATASSGTNCASSSATKSSTGEGEGSSGEPQLPSSVGLRVCAVMHFLQSNHPREVSTFLDALLQNAQTNTPTIKHVTAAFIAALPKSKRADGKDLLRSVLRNDEYIVACEQAKQNAISSGITGVAHRAFFNGVPVQPNYDVNLMRALRDERVIIRDLVASGDITDATDPEKIVLEAAPVITTRVNALLTESSVEFVEIPAPPSTSPISSSGRSNHVIRPRAYVMAKPQSMPFKDTTVVVAVDATSRDVIMLLDHTLQFVLHHAHGINTRLQILHSSSASALESSDDCTSGACMVVRILDALSATLPKNTNSLIQSQQGLMTLHRIIRLLRICSDRSSSNILSQSQCSLAVETQIGLLGKFENVDLISAVADWKAKQKIPEEGVRTFQWLGVSKGQCAVVLNGRIIRDACHMTSHDLELLAGIETASGTSIVVDALTDSEVTQDDMSDTTMYFASAFRKYREQSGSRENIASKFLTQETVVSWGSHDSTVQVTVILDPMSANAQWIVPVLLTLRDSLHCALTVHFNPTLDLTTAPLNNFYRFVLDPRVTFNAMGHVVGDGAVWMDGVLPSDYVLTMKLHTPNAWFVESEDAVHDLDNLQLVDAAGDVVHARFELSELLITGHVQSSKYSPHGLQLLLLEGSPSSDSKQNQSRVVADTLVMDNLNYFQLKALPNTYHVTVAPGRAASIFYLTKGEGSSVERSHVEVVLDSFDGAQLVLPVDKREGKEHVELLAKDPNDSSDEQDSGFWNSLTSMFGGGSGSQGEDNTVHIFSVASGHLYERFLRIMMVSVVANTKAPVKFWLLRNFLSPAFKKSLPALAAHYKFDYALVTYKWPSWLHAQTEKQRVIWGNKILFLDVLFPINLKKIIYVDSDQTVYGDMSELWNMDLHNRPYAYVPFCNSNQETRGFRFWEQGFWSSHLRGKPYHISALYVVDLVRFRRMGAGDTLRILYDQLSKDPNSLANLDQDLPNYAQHMVPIHSLPQEWLWCETWCSNATRKFAKTIDLCNNPMTKRPKLQAARDIIGDLWVNYDNEIRNVLESSATTVTVETNNNPAEAEKTTTTRENSVGVEQKNVPVQNKGNAGGKPNTHTDL